MIEIPTSGTTGEKKICLVSEDAFEARHDSIVQFFGQENMVGYGTSPFYSHKKVFILGACAKYGTITDDISRAIIIVFIQKSDNEFASLDLGHLKKAKNCKFFVCGGKDIGAENWEVLQKTLPQAKILSQYGMAEAGAICITSGECVENGLVGTPYPGVEIKIVDEEVYVKTPGLMTGYKDQEPTGEWFNTRDKGYLDKGGKLHLYGNRT